MELDLGVFPSPIYDVKAGASGLGGLDVHKPLLVVFVAPKLGTFTIFL